jgi:hypothetical protein
MRVWTEIAIVFILDSGVTSQEVIDQSMISISDIKKILGREAKQNPRHSS